MSKNFNHKERYKLYTLIFAFSLVLSLIITSVYLLNESITIQNSQAAELKSVNIKVGTLYEYIDNTDCVSKYPLLSSYIQNKDKADSQIKDMVKNGVKNLRFILWYSSNNPKTDLGILSSKGGKLSDDHANNLKELLSSLKTLGVEKVTFNFSPQDTNSPYSQNYDSKTYSDNISFITSTVNIIKNIFPNYSIDLLNDGAPNKNVLSENMYNQVNTYIKSIYSDYIKIEDKSKATVSVSEISSFQNLITTMQTIGEPSYYELHLMDNNINLSLSLENANKILKDTSSKAKLVLGEVFYNDESSSRSIYDFSSKNMGLVTEVNQYSNKNLEDPSLACVNPPYKTDSYSKYLAK